jgi:hypothetical protein
MSAARRDAGSRVAVRVAALCLDPAGRLSDHLVCGPAVRGGLLLDLALAGRVEQTDDSIVIDQEPTGFAPADRLLAAIAVEPERSLDGWLDERRIGLRDVAAAAIGSGHWSEHRGPLGFGRRYTDLSSAHTPDRERRPTDDPSGWTPIDACVTAVGAGAGLLDREWLGWSETPPGPILAATGNAAWLCAAVVDHLTVLTARFQAEVAGLGPF